MTEKIKKIRFMALALAHTNTPPNPSLYNTNIARRPTFWEPATSSQASPVAVGAGPCRGIYQPGKGLVLERHFCGGGTWMVGAEVTLDQLAE